MKLTWRDIVTTLIVIGGAIVVYAMYNNYSWMGLENWRDGIAAITVGGLIILLLSNFDFSNRSTLNVSEIVVGAIAVILAIAGILIGTQSFFFSLSLVVGILWALDTARHIRHSWLDRDTHGSSLIHRHAHVH